MRVGVFTVAAVVILSGRAVFFTEGKQCLYFTQWFWVTGDVGMGETTYYGDKVYLPREVREKLGLVDGDVLYINVEEKGVAKMRVVRECQATQEAIEKLENPPNLGAVKGRLSRKEIYEDII